MRKFLFLNFAQRFSDVTLLVFRVFIGTFLFWSGWAGATNAAHMQEFVTSFALHGFPAATTVAPMIAWLLLAVGAGFILGLFTRWAGIVCAMVCVATIAVTYKSGGMAVFPVGCLLVFSLFLGTHGAGRISVDEILRGNDQPRPNGGVRFKV